jgi:hypothetical protein
VLYRDAANTLALRNGTAAQAFNIYNTYTDGTNYERVAMAWSANVFTIASEKGVGVGSYRTIKFGDGNAAIQLAGISEVNNGGVNPIGSDSRLLGQSTLFWRDLYLSRVIQGSKSKTLSESSATSLVKIAVPQTAGSNFADATVQWVVYAADATDTQVRSGSTYLAAVNKAGTETCTVSDVGTTTVAVSAGTLTCTSSCVTGLTDEVEFALNCVSSLTQTTLKAQYRSDMLQPNTYTPQ